MTYNNLRCLGSESSILSSSRCRVTLDEGKMRLEDHVAAGRTLGKNSWVYRIAQAFVEAINSPAEGMARRKGIWKHQIAAQARVPEDGRWPIPPIRYHRKTGNWMTRGWTGFST